MKIMKFVPYNLRNDAHFQFCRDFMVAISAFAEIVLKVKAQFDEWTTRFGKEDEALKKIVKSSLTQKINDVDRLRDNTYSGMVDIVHAYLKCNNVDKSEAAKRLKIVFDTYGNVTKKPLKEQTSAVYNILQELQGEKYGPDCAKVTISDWVGRLASENQTFDSLMTNRFDESAARCSIVLKDARRDVDESYKKICDLVTAYVIMEGEEPYAAFIKRLNEVIKKYSVKSHHRHGSGAEEDEAEDDSESVGVSGAEGGAAA